MEWVCRSPGCGERFGNAGALGRHERTHEVHKAAARRRALAGHAAEASSRELPAALAGQLAAPPFASPPAERVYDEGGGASELRGNALGQRDLDWLGPNERTPDENADEDASDGGGGSSSSSNEDADAVPPHASLRPGAVKIAETMQRAKMSLRQIDMVLARIRPPPRGAAGRPDVLHPVERARAAAAPDASRFGR